MRNICFCHIVNNTLLDIMMDTISAARLISSYEVSYEMKIRPPVCPPKGLGAFRIKLLALCFFFAVGAVLGYVLHGMVTQEDDLLLREYVQHYARLAATQDGRGPSVFSVIGVYFRYPAAAFILGSIGAGVFLVPVLLVMNGFALMFSVACFCSALGRGGLAVALATFGLRCMIVLPVLLMLSVISLNCALCRLHEHRNGHGKRKSSYRAEHFASFAGCAALLAFGVVLELILAPKLLSLALAGIL